MAIGNHVPLIHAAQGALYYDTNASGINFSGALNALVDADEQVIMCKEINITLPKVTSEQVPLLGISSTTAGSGVLNTGTFQNAIQDYKNATNAEISGTLALTLANDGDSPVLPDFINLASGVGQAISTAHHRHTFGDSASGQAQNLGGVIFVVFDNNIVAGTAALVNPTVTIEDIKPTGTDGHWEISFTANCLPCDFALEVEDQD